jgi:Aspartyl protease
VGGESRRFVVDTGIGVTVVSSDVGARSDVTALGQKYAGRRMSGQVVEAPLVQLPEVVVGGHRAEQRVAGVFDLGTEFDGILSPAFFEPYALTIDPVCRTLTIGDPPADGVTVPLDVRRDGPSVAPFVSLVLPTGRTITVEVDTGSETLILDPRFMADCGLSPDDPALETETGTDETGYDWVRLDPAARDGQGLGASGGRAADGTRRAPRDLPGHHLRRAGRHRLPRTFPVDRRLRR